METNKTICERWQKT